MWLRVMSAIANDRSLRAARADNKKLIPKRLNGCVFVL
jgi:hypothetical protein